MFAAIFVVLFFLSVMALAAMTLVVVVYRFYKNLLCSEGYLMHTPPGERAFAHMVEAHRGCVLVCGHERIYLRLPVWGGLPAEVWTQVLSELRALFERLSAAYGIGAFELLSVVIELCVLLLLGSVSSCLLFYASLAIGHSLARNKLLASLECSLASLALTGSHDAAGCHHRVQPARICYCIES